MSYLSKFKMIIIERGKNYFKNNNIIFSKKINDELIQGVVKGKIEDSYQVLINIKHPKSSKCTCLYHVNEGKLCKHMAAMYFYNFPEKMKEYEYFFENYDYERKENYDYNEDDEFFLISDEEYDKLLVEFIDSLTKEQLKNILKEELLEYKVKTYYKYLKKKYILY